MSDPGTTELRQSVVAYLETQLLGPVDGPKERLRTAPHYRYLFGTLFPQKLTSDVCFEGEALDDSEQEEAREDPINLSGQWMPSSLGLSFYLAHGTSVTVEVSAGAYQQEKQDRESIWQRTPYEPAVFSISPEKTGGSVFNDHGLVHSKWRSFREGFLVTVSLVNQREQEDSDESLDPSDCLYQVSLSVAPGDDGTFEDYPRYDLLVSDEEEEELQLLYRRRKSFAVGHGCSADWVEESGVATLLNASLIPRHEVKPVSTRIGLRNIRVLSLAYLADDEIDVAELSVALSQFVGEYQAWIDELCVHHPDVPVRLAAAQERILARLKVAAGRMRDGISAIVTGDTELTAFRLANRAMHLQMIHSARDRGGTRHKRNEACVTPAVTHGTQNAWRPFQLAYFLLTARSIVDDDHADREVVDLIWFPTGGGKTEAYLLVTAFQILLRRLRDPVHGLGTTVITRYTLRLLTAQQFQRASALICACELIRRERSDLGCDPISIGLWVGSAGSPNKYVHALEKFRELREGELEDNPFQLNACPWCGTEIVPDVPSDSDADYGIRVTKTSFQFYCPSNGCPFHAELPINVVDQALYQSPPTFLIATVDKFAQLAWVKHGGVFFGRGGHLPPALIIQDELHLISGPLGTVAGLYEAAIGALLSLGGARPKILASTATIRRADQQVLGLYGREVRIFPPSGLTADDSFFSRTDQDAPGRLYVGLMASSHSSTTAQVDTMATLIQAPIELGLKDGPLDAYWSLIAYHNSLKELGKTTTLLRDDVPLRINSMASDQSRRRVLNDDVIESLTSESQNTLEILQRLSLSCDERRSLSVVTCTNMLSVGIDVSRLSLMLIVGQPKTSSEYIQASSRVGRADVPGLVFVLFRPTKPRDRSHYESFRTFHQALYKFVEPTSVTPFSPPARERALHAALVVAIRHGTRLSANDSAKDFDPAQAEEIATVAALNARAQIVDPAEANATAQKLEDLVGEWGALAEAARQQGTPLQYHGDVQFTTLLRRFGEQRPGWETLDSMRNVDAECGLLVWGSGS